MKIFVQNTKLIIVTSYTYLLQIFILCVFISVWIFIPLYKFHIRPRTIEKFITEIILNFNLESER